MNPSKGQPHVAKAQTEETTVSGNRNAPKGAVTGAPHPTVLHLRRPSAMPDAGEVDGTDPVLLLEMLRPALDSAFGDFGLGPVTFGAADSVEICETAHERTVAIQEERAPGLCLLLAFGDDAAWECARRIVLATGADIAVPDPAERVELLHDALGELANRVMGEVLSSRRDSVPISPPHVFPAKGTRFSLVPVDFWHWQVQAGFGACHVFASPSASVSFLTAAKAHVSASARHRGLIADDSRLMRMAIRKALQSAGHEVVAEAGNGTEAVEQYRRHHPDFVTLDVTMPGMSGWDALKIIRAECPEAKVVVCSAVAACSSRRHTQTSRTCRCLGKPFKNEDLLAAVNELLSAVEPAPAVPVSEPSDMDCLTGVVLGHFRIGEALGQGGVGTVYKGIDLSLNRQVGVKVLSQTLASTPEMVVQFLAEARALAKVKHPHVVQVYYAGTAEGWHFFAMELLPGPDLESILKQSGPTPPGIGLGYAIQAAEGLQAAAEAGLIHGDVKPANLLLKADGSACLTDFGLARAVAGGAQDQAISFCGSPAYMAPEQHSGGDVDLRADIYALGCTLHHMLTGQVPYPGSDIVEVALQHAFDPVPTVPTLNAEGNRILARMLAKEPADRYPDYATLLIDFRRLAEAMGPDATHPGGVP
ncbi:MAG: hypothetical protein A3K19_22170 [Lentisphaerae bacterium RIFOXYB12_FULL_65_16]|nr:MAG: hypothetical protein A3K18_21400 [Lentisphaerae bacterium RIFOXYA12_64_32]OGV93568.1 MAG: hypothetical protein A3K19_22170 [Lentisphaerae bacterium RIFOXYB12_FULL_65_16]